MSLSRKITAYSTSSSWKSIPHVSFIIDFDITNLYSEYLSSKRMSTENSASISLNTIIVKLIAESISHQNKLFASFSYNSFLHTMRMITSHSVDINIPWILNNGEMIPIRFENVADKTLIGFSNEVNHIKDNLDLFDFDVEMLHAIIENTKDEIKHLNFTVISRFLPILYYSVKLKRKKGTKNIYNIINPNGIIISNTGSLLGGINGKFGLLEIIKPKVLAIGIGSIENRVVPADEINIFDKKQILPITIAFDHRALDFGDIVPFISALRTKFINYKSQT